MHIRVFKITIPICNLIVILLYDVPVFIFKRKFYDDSDNDDGGGAAAAYDDDASYDGVTVMMIMMMMIIFIRFVYNPFVIFKLTW